MQAKGHRNITSQHKNTLEFTTEKTLTKRGDCIVAVDFKFNKEEIKKILQYQKIKITIKAGNIKEEIFAYPNKKFSDFNEFVIRKSDFISKRTFAIKSNKSAYDLDDRLKKELQKNPQKIQISIEPVKIKAIIFDFESTLEEWQKTEAGVENEMASMLSKKYSINKEKFSTLFYETKQFFEINSKMPTHLDRTNWYKKLFRELGIKISKKEISSIVNLYWQLILKKATLFPETVSVLEQLKAKYKLAILSNSDGNKKIKLERINHLKVNKYFNYISTSDDVGFNKPDKRTFLFIVKKLKLKPYECMMIGDNPEHDLLNSKSLGMTTILIRRGRHHQNKEIPYADFDLKTLKRIPKIVSVLNK